NLSHSAIISRTGIISTKIIDGGYNSEKFGDFIDISASVGAFSNSPILIMDNASIHETQFILNKLEDYGVEVKFLSPYSPDLNPIENCFSIIKSRLDRIRPRAITREQLKENLENIITALSGKSGIFENLYSHMNVFINNLLNGTE
ncbi:hypothetical protein CDIK_1035, partial [Cucumispora dikerogammari]